MHRLAELSAAKEFKRAFNIFMLPIVSIILVWIEINYGHSFVTWFIFCLTVPLLLFNIVFLFLNVKGKVYVTQKLRFRVLRDYIILTFMAYLVHIIWHFIAGLKDSNYFVSMSYGGAFFC